MRECIGEDLADWMYGFNVERRAEARWGEVEWRSGL